MDDLMSKLNELLKNPENMEKFKNLSNMLGLDSKPPSGGDGFSKSDGNCPPPAADGEAIKMVAKLAPILSGFRKEDESTILLNALRPFLSEKKQKKLDEAIKLLQFVRILPLIKSSGIF